MTHDAIAIIGIGCRLPGARSPAELSALLAAKKPTFPRLRPDRWDPEAFGEPAHAGILGEYDIDFRTFRIPPAVVQRLHRMERALMASIQAGLLDAGLAPHAIENAHRTQTHVAASTLGFDPVSDHMARVRLPETRRALEAAIAELGGGREREHAVIMAALNEAAPSISVDSLMTTGAVAAGRVANAFDFGGGHFAHDVGPASSLAALAAAVHGLASGESDLAIATGISPLVTATQVLAHVRRGLASERGESIASIGEEPHGTLLGEGAVTLVLARLSDARAAGQRVYAVVRGTGASSAGRRSAAQAIHEGTVQAVKSALSVSRIDAERIDLVECQCAGLPGIDPIELDAISRAYADVGRVAKLPVVSVAPHLGWLGAASGMASVASAALAIASGQRPFAGVNVALEGVAGGVGLEARGASHVRVAAVSSPGFGQVIHHAVLAHADVPMTSRGATQRVSTDRKDCVSILGFGANVPGAPNASALYELLAERRSMVTAIPEHRFRFEDHDPEVERGAVPRTALGGTVPTPVPDAKRMRIPPVATRWIDGAVVLAFDACEQALDAYGWQPGSLDPERVGIWVGHLAIRTGEIESERTALSSRNVATARAALARAGLKDDALIELFREKLVKDTLPITEDTLETTSSLACAAKVAARYDIRGPIAAVDAGCGSSLVAVHLACSALLRHEIDLAVVCGVAWNVFPDYYAALATLGALSFRGSRPFEADADGMVPAEGAASVILKRRSDAVRDRDRVRATILGTAIAGDGRGTTIFAPNVAGQDRALRRAYAAAGIDPTTVGVFEAHGTGTPTGDPVELTAIDALLASHAASEPRRAPPWVGSAKSNVGHLSSAAGMVGLIKTTFALERRVVLPTVHSGSLEGAHEALVAGRLALPQKVEAWRAPEKGHPRRAGVSAFGLGGIDAHVVLEEALASVDRRSSSSVRPAAPAAESTRTAARFVPALAPVSLPKNNGSERTALREGDTVLLVTDGDGGGISEELFPHLLERGVRPVLLDAAHLKKEALEHEVRKLDADHGGLRGVIDLSALKAMRMRGEAARKRDVCREVEEATRAARRCFAIVRALWSTLNAARETGRHFTWLGATAMGGGLGLSPTVGVGEGGAMAGFLKSLKQDLPWIVARAVDLDPTEDSEWIAQTLVAEIEAGGDRVEAGWSARQRFVPVVRLAPHGPRRELGGGTILFSGGSRGVVLECARALARRHVPVVVTGRTVPAGDEDWARMSDEALVEMHNAELLRRRGDGRAIRDALSAHEVRLRRRALRRVLDEVAAAGEPFEYRNLDVLDVPRLTALVSELRVRPGGLQGIVHGAMTPDSRAIERASYESFDATLRTKLEGLSSVLASLGGEAPRFVIAFGSISGRFGYPSHEDYAAANDAMARILASWGEEHPGCHAATIDWTAWNDIGAAADPSIAGLVRKLGVVPIGPDEGTRWLIEEIEGHGRESIAVIVNERHVRQWPFAMAVIDANGCAPTRLDDRGQPLDPGAFPLVDVVLGADGDDERGVEREFALGADTLLEDHHLHHSPVLPGSFAIELLAEAARAAHGMDTGVVEITNFEIEAPLRFANDVPRTVRVQARREGHEVVTRASLPLTLPSSLPQEREYCVARVLLGPPPPIAGASSTALPEAPASARIGSFFDDLLVPIRLGARFRHIAWVLRSERAIEGVLRPPSQHNSMTRTTSPDFVVDPFVLDAAFQVAGNWDAIPERGFISVPVAMERLVVHARRAAGAGAKVRVNVREIRDTEVVYDIAIETLDGAPLMTVQGVILRRIESAARPSGS